MDKKEFKKKPYVKSAIEVVRADADLQILAGSPQVQPGGGSGGSISVIPPEEDDEEEISGAKKFNMWSEWED